MLTFSVESVFETTLGMIMSLKCSQMATGRMARMVTLMVRQERRARLGGQGNSTMHLPERATRSSVMTQYSATLKARNHTGIDLWKVRMARALMKGGGRSNYCTLQHRS